jgi:hypothetical protein
MTVGMESVNEFNIQKNKNKTVRLREQCRILRTFPNLFYLIPCITLHLGRFTLLQAAPLFQFANYEGMHALGAVCSS